MGAESRLLHSQAQRGTDFRDPRDKMQPSNSDVNTASVAIGAVLAIYVTLLAAFWSRVSLGGRDARVDQLNQNKLERVRAKALLRQKTAWIVPAMILPLVLALIALPMTLQILRGISPGEPFNSSFALFLLVELICIFLTVLFAIQLIRLGMKWRTAKAFSAPAR
jgi:hypothetical protein